MKKNNHKTKKSRQQKKHEQNYEETVRVTNLRHNNSKHFMF